MFGSFSITLLQPFINDRIATNKCPAYFDAEVGGAEKNAFLKSTSLANGG
jgi:hypothetical protein